MTSFLHRGLFAMLLAVVPSFLVAQTVAFPGAEGFGAHATGGRGGRVIEVTNLNADTSAGSFWKALRTPGTDPITIVFRVSGTIKYKDSNFVVTRSNITIAGQTAPGDGICIRKTKMYFASTITTPCSNVIIRYLRFRAGDEAKKSFASLDVENATNIIIDHCSISWSMEENMDNYDTHNTTVQYCILSEGLYYSYNIKGSRAYGAAWGGQNASFHHNLFAHNNSRSPRMEGCRSHDTCSLSDFRNNVIYNYAKGSAIYGGEVEIRDTLNKKTPFCHINWINNYYQPGPATSSTQYIAQPYYNDGSGTTYGYGQWYFSGNYMAGGSSNATTINANNWAGVDSSKITSISNIKSDTAFTVDSVTTQSAQDAYALVLASAGASLPKRDTVDGRIIAQMKGDYPYFASGAYGTNKGIIDSQDSVGGWPVLNSLTPAPDTDHDGIPDYWEIANGLNPADSTDGAIITTDGYSNLEHYLNAIVAGTAMTTGIQSDKNSVPSKFALSQNYPNPFNPTTNISYQLPVSGHVSLKVFDLLGREVALLVNEQKFAGTYTATFNATNLSSGVYFYQLKIGNLVTTKKMLLMK
jgi:hypothetical protein